jgi:CheY-like chemotaxis protein
MRKPTHRILVTEDDADIRESLELALSGHGYGVLTAENGKVALDKLREGYRPDLVLLDLAMPVMDGFEFLEALRGDRHLREIPVLVMTATPPVAPLEMVAGVLEKPCDLDVVLDIVDRLCRPRGCAQQVVATRRR